MPYKDREKRLKHAREYGKGWYQGHKQEVMEHRKQRQTKIHNWFRRYKSILQCVDCGVAHPALLQFHHRDKSTKSFAISKIMSRAASIKQIITEIEKCDVVCVNCHANRHWREKHQTDSWEEVLGDE